MSQFACSSWAGWKRWVGRASWRFLAEGLSPRPSRPEEEGSNIYRTLTWCAHNYVSPWTRSCKHATANACTHRNALTDRSVQTPARARTLARVRRRNTRTLASCLRAPKHSSTRQMRVRTKHSGTRNFARAQALEYSRDRARAQTRALARSRPCADTRASFARSHRRARVHYRTNPRVRAGRQVHLRSPPLFGLAHAHICAVGLLSGAPASRARMSVHSLTAVCSACRPCGRSRWRWWTTRRGIYTRGCSSTSAPSTNWSRRSVCRKSRNCWNS